MRNKKINNVLKVVVSFFTFMMIHSNASAHPGLEHHPTLHGFMHLVIAASIVLAVIAAGFYLFRSKPVLKRIRLKK